MISLRKRAIRRLLALIASAGIGTLCAQTPSLKIGNPAPPLHPIAWIKGQPVERFEPGRVYVVEFWASWCPPCLRMIPKLSELQRRYSGCLTVIGVDAREIEGSNGSLEHVKAFVAQQGERMDYTVAMDDPIKHPVFDTWMTAGGAFGIPTTFVVDKAGRLVWVGHPSSEGDQAFQAIVEQTLSGRSDLAGAAATQEAINRETAKRLKDAKLLKRMWQAEKRRDYAAVIVEADKVIAQEPSYGPEVFKARMGALLHVNEDAAFEFATEKSQEPAFVRVLGATNYLEFWGAVGRIIAHEGGLSKGSYRRAVEYLNRLTAVRAGAYWNWVSLAKAYQRLGDKQQAIEAQERAIATAKASGLEGERLERLQQDLEIYRTAKG